MWYISCRKNKPNDSHLAVRETDGDKIIIMQKVANKFNQLGKMNNTISAPVDDDILGLGSLNPVGADDTNNGEDEEDAEQSTPWELLADAILANPVTRFTDNKVYPTFNVPAIIDN